MFSFNKHIKRTIGCCRTRRANTTSNEALELKTIKKIIDQMYSKYDRFLTLDMCRTFKLSERSSINIENCFILFEFNTPEKKLPPFPCHIMAVDSKGRAHGLLGNSKFTPKDGIDIQEALKHFCAQPPANLNGVYGDVPIEVVKFHACQPSGKFKKLCDVSYLRNDTINFDELVANIYKVSLKYDANIRGLPPEDFQLAALQNTMPANGAPVNCADTIMLASKYPRDLN